MMAIYTAASFFSGIGGLDLAFAWAGFDIRVQCEIDEYCRKVLWKNREYWHNAKQLKDIKHVTKTEVGNVDVIFGGFPCQDISVAGKRAGVTRQTRSGLWFELLRIIRQVRPRIIVLENVANISNIGGTIVTATLAEIGYDAIWQHIRASDVGATHQRERWFCIAFRNSNSYRTGTKRGIRRRQKPYTTGIRKTLAHPKSERLQKRGKLRSAKPPQRVSRASTSLVNSKRTRLERENRTRTQSRNITRPIECKGRYKRRSAQSRKSRTHDGISCRLDRHNGQWGAFRGQEPHDYEPSWLTGVRENRVDRIKALGNAVVPQQAYPIALTVKRFLDATIGDNDARTKDR